MPVEPVSAVHALQAVAPNAAAAGVSPLQDPGLQAVQLAQQEQIFSQLMQSTTSQMLSQSMQAPKLDEGEDD